MLEYMVSAFVLKLIYSGHSFILSVDIKRCFALQGQLTGPIDKY